MVLRTDIFRMLYTLQSLFPDMVSADLQDNSQGDILLSQFSSQLRLITINNNFFKKTLHLTIEG